MSIDENIRSVRKRIEGAAKRSGRSPDEITLVAVTKNHTVSEIQQVINSAVTNLGENRVQELLPKREALGDVVAWHFIGHLQRNKVKYIIPLIYLIQSVDSIALAREINKQCRELGKVQDVLLEVNVSGEASKYGFSPEEVLFAVDELARFKNVQIKGLMMMAPFISDIGLLRLYFAKMKELFDNLSKRQGPNFEMLSMGMTNDFEIAIEEGSNMVRVGTAIFTP
ncbi:MAG: YggS family pyridoxal phosphate-dependent enzyme [Candidatus Aquicultor secundus]|uniref:Pyridoxal phosphate homeostasis protein n=1 Tax=Candidatus Aquicultor secundus TaxID=1973895 RepID=A0A2M7T5B8_9ACTN|nr:YggS family pyridoxal phosphate-dependent enzyme [Candidatus Aquicultor secundus]NCO66311.1 YggS family pyridoxal phosphate-dependent enzyme [Solirubrobacter sp.]OIO84634.1 MAG: YggS family pyridoxal phosphate enzyme [Candidatus Aquicultor secundus]PIU27587.1 MAG: YggS family pyridoxal phosphate-dependent enzyme [Candidatus Aquicultor secundus]PIW23092.1 MAG: YggS family pyridoxal phosphate-dependent enzyme [Candidatus Aquicultor secundus]PIX51775.1 MAG: YggS family pyridoxal phosphate-depe